VFAKEAWERALGTPKSPSTAVSGVEKDWRGEELDSAFGGDMEIREGERTYNYGVLDRVVISELSFPSRRLQPISTVITHTFRVPIRAMTVLKRL
jgi:hypothetical protein